MLLPLKFISIILLLFLAIISCNKKETLTRATQHGANTFSCIMNGEIFKPKINPFTFALNRDFIGSFSEGNNYLFLQVYEPLREGYGFKRDIYIEFENLQIGTQLFSEKNTGRVDFIVDPSLFEVYIANTAESGSLTITRLDTAKNIISGTFSFTALPKFSLYKTVSVTEGRFDIRYN